MGIHKKYSFAYLYFKFVTTYKKGTMHLFIHIISMHTHILTIKRNYVNNETHISVIDDFYNEKGHSKNIMSL